MIIRIELGNGRVASILLSGFEHQSTSGEASLKFNGDTGH
jgi:hypothetical protein